MLTTDWKITQLQKIYKQQPKLVDDALEQLLAKNPELNWSLVLNAYLEEEISLGKAAELLNLHSLELRERFLKLGIPIRQGAGTIEEAKAEIEAIRNWEPQK